jgi:hypothetical protein
MRWLAPLTILFLACSVVLGALALSNLVPDPLMDAAFWLAVVSFLGLFIALLFTEAEGCITRGRLKDREVRG